MESEKSYNKLNQIDSNHLRLRVDWNFNRLTSNINFPVSIYFLFTNYECILSNNKIIQNWNKQNGIKNKYLYY